MSINKIDLVKNPFDSFNLAIFYSIISASLIIKNVSYSTSQKKICDTVRL